MIPTAPFYHGNIRKTIVAFGSVFSNIYIQRREGDSVAGTIAQTIQVPLAYAPKEKWMVRIDSDPELAHNTYTSLPRMSFEITGYHYDAARKLNRANTIACGNGSSPVTTIGTPVPYNINISLYILTKTQEDALQVIEQILPSFSPEHNLAINMVPEMGIIQDVPIVLNSITSEDSYEGDFQTRRFVLHTLNFTIKTNLYGATSTSKVITTVIANVGTNDDFTLPTETYTAHGDVTTGLVTSESWLENF